MLNENIYCFNAFITTTFSTFNTEGQSEGFSRLLFYCLLSLLNLLAVRIFKGRIGRYIFSILSAQRAQKG